MTQSQQLLRRTRLQCLYEELRLWDKFLHQHFLPGNNNIAIAVYFCHLNIRMDIISMGAVGKYPIRARQSQ